MPPQSNNTSSVVIRVKELEIGDKFVMFGTIYLVWKIDEEKVFYKVDGSFSHYNQTFYKKSQQQLELIYRKKKATTNVIQRSNHQ